MNDQNYLFFFWIYLNNDIWTLFCIIYWNFFSAFFCDDVKETLDDICSVKPDMVMQIQE